jgi:hypothetical protein
MSHEEFPALYLAADDAAVSSQKQQLAVQATSSLLLILGAAATAETHFFLLPLVSALLFLGSLAIFIYGRYVDLDGRWYKGRALAESVKTTTWRWMMNADPFHQQSEQAAAESFRKLLDEFLHENRDIGRLLAGDWCEKEQVTPVMLELRNASLNVKKEAYLSDRIEEQRRWYANKSKWNRTRSRRWFAWLCGLYGLAVLLLFVRVVSPTLPYWPIEVLAVTASAAVAWMQLKRFNELASAYGLTAHEIGIIKLRFAGVDSAESLAAFVSDAENAFSREHTQWAARRDHPSV